jgi:hypothetical protein
MFESRRLIELAARKAALRGAIATRRRECAEAARLALRPLVWIDQARAVWRRLAPWVAPVHTLFASRSRGGLRRTLAWLSVALGAWGAFRRFRPRAAP